MITRRTAHYSRFMEWSLGRVNLDGVDTTRKEKKNWKQSLQWEEDRKREERGRQRWKRERGAFSLPQRLIRSEIVKWEERLHIRVGERERERDGMRREGKRKWEGASENESLFSNWKRKRSNDGRSQDTSLKAGHDEDRDGRSNWKKELRTRTRESKDGWKMLSHSRSSSASDGQNFNQDANEAAPI